MAIEIRSTATFEGWFSRLRDPKAKARILTRLDRLSDGNPGDTRSVGAGVLEMRITYGPGYRLYYTVRNKALVILLVGGDKSSQSADIRRAQALAREL